MKIRITEDQARRLNIINPNSDPIVKIEQYVKLKGDVIDGMYRNLSNLSLIELLSPEFSLETNGKIINQKLDDMETEVYKLDKIAYTYLDDLSDDEAVGLDAKIDDASSMLKNKIDGLRSILNKLIEMSEYTKFFNNQTPIDITNQQ